MRTQKPAEEVKTPYLETCDLRGITRNSDRLVTRVRLYPDWDRSNAVPWLIFGQANVSRNERQKNHRLEARMTEGVTDFEHDSAYALVLPLIGLQFDDLVISYHTTHLIAWVDPNEAEQFRVPTNGYDPTTHPDAHRCKDKSCLQSDPKGHIIIPEGFYQPPSNRDLFRKVAGKKVEITIGPVWPAQE